MYIYIYIYVYIYIYIYIYNLYIYIYIYIIYIYIYIYRYVCTYILTSQLLIVLKGGISSAAGLLFDISNSILH